MKVFRPFFAIGAFLLLVGLACIVGGPTAAPTAQPQPTKEQAATDAPPPTDSAGATDTPATSGSATDTPAASAGGDQYFTDDFSGTMDNYTVKNLGTGSEDKMDVNIKDGYMVFDLTGANLWVYVTYNPFKYKDVTISMVADNRGKNNNNVTLFCRKSDEGWYEFNIANNGLYWIYAFDAQGLVAKGYNTIYNGGSTAIKQGKDVNTYAATCKGNQLSLSINGTEVKTIKDSKFQFREGNVGFGVSSFGVTPILVEVDKFIVSQPK